MNKKKLIRKIFWCIYINNSCSRCMIRMYNEKKKLLKRCRICIHCWINFFSILSFGCIIWLFWQYHMWIDHQYIFGLIKWMEVWAEALRINYSLRLLSKKYFMYRNCWVFVLVNLIFFCSFAGCSINENINFNRIYCIVVCCHSGCWNDSWFNRKRKYKFYFFINILFSFIRF